MKGYLLECCIDTLEAAQAAMKGGATRLEVCANLVIGGTTPSPALLEEIRRAGNIPLRAMVRPRFGDFLYTDSELRIMAEDIRRFRALGIDGVVLGVLTSDGTLDLGRMEPLLRAAEGMGVTLHRAFDLTADPLQALEDARSLGIDTILTSGQKVTAWEGRALLEQLYRNRGNIRILAGSGVDAGVIAELRRAAGIDAYHLSGRVVTDSPMRFRREGVPMGLSSMSEYERWGCSAEKDALARAVLEEIK